MVWVGGCFGDLTQDSQPDPRARVVGSGAVGRQAGSRHECDGLGVTIESGGVCGEVSCAFPQPDEAKCGPSVAIFTHVFKRNEM